MHCFAHRLNLVLVSSCMKHDDISNYFDVLKELHKFFSSSVCKSKLRSSQQELYRKVQDENNHSFSVVSDNDPDCSESSDSESDNPIENMPNELNEINPIHSRKFITLKAFCTTRWHYSYRNSASIKLILQAILEALINLTADSNRERSARARMLISRWDLEFIFINESLNSILGHTYILNKLLQAQDVDLNEAMRLVQLLKVTLHDSKNSFEVHWQKANEVNRLHIYELRN